MYKKVFILLLMVLLIGNVAALDFDNVKQYDKSTETYKVTNAFGLGKKLVEIKLLTPRVFERGIGYIHIAEFELKDYNILYKKAFQDMDFYQIDKGMEEFTREFDYKYLTTGLEKVWTYKKVCNTLKNGTSVCYQEQDKQIKVEVDKWEKFNDISELPKQKSIRIRIYTETQEGDNVEWIPTLFGEYLDEWAVWTASLNVGLDAYYNMNGNSGTVIDIVNGHNMTLGSSTQQATGIIDYGVEVETTTSALSNADDWNLTFWNSNWSVSGWAYFDTVKSGDFIFSPDGAEGEIRFDGDGNLRARLWDGSTNFKLGHTVIIGHWYHIAWTRNKVDGMVFYINGSNVASDATTNDFAVGVGSSTTLGWKNSAATTMNGTLDEWGIWNRCLTPTEITQLYNGGVGINYSSNPSKYPNINLTSPIDNYNSTSQTMIFNGIVDDNINVTNVSLYIDSVLNETNNSGLNNSNYIFTKIVAEGNHNWTYIACDNEGQCTTATTRDFSIDSTLPLINGYSPITTLDYHKINTNLTLNYSITDTNLDDCWYVYNGGNHTLNCSTNSTINTTSMSKSLTLFANDTFGNENSQVLTWNYRLLEMTESFTTSVVEGSNNYFNMSFVTNGTAITIGNLTYNNTNYIASLSSIGNNYTLTRLIAAPSVGADTNISFYYKISTQGGWSYNITAQNQTVTNFNVDNCSVNDKGLFNFTMVDENLQIKINDSSTIINATLNLQIYVTGTTTKIADYYTSFNGMNPFGVCLSNNLSGGEKYTMDLQLQYDAKGYASEFYHIQQETLDSSDFPTNITLYDINDSADEIFNLLVRDNSYLPLSNALVFIERKYIDEGVFKVVEIPKTDNGGETIAHLVPDDVIYNFRIVQDGTTIAVFNNVIAQCQNPSLYACEIDFNAFSAGLTTPDFEVGNDLNFTLGYNETSRIITSVFEIPSNEVSTIVLNVTSEDALGTFVCTDTITSTSGTLSCVVPAAIGNSTILASLYKDGTEQGKGNLKVGQNPLDLYKGVVVFFGLFVLLTLIGAGVSDNPVITTIFLMLSVIFLAAMNLVANDGFIGATSTVLVFIVGMIIVLVKAGRRN